MYVCIDSGYCMLVGWSRCVCVISICSYARIFHVGLACVVFDEVMLCNVRSGCDNY